MPLKNENVSNWLQTGRMYQNRRDEFSAFAEKKILKSKIYKKRNNKHLVAKGENLYIEINKSHDPLGQNLFVPVVVLNGIFMMEDTL